MQDSDALRITFPMVFSAVRLRAAWAVIALASLPLVGCSPDTANAGNRAGELSVSRENSSQEGSSQELDQTRTTSIVRATARVAPAVVSVNVLRTRPVRARSMWESLYLPPGAQRRSASFGSGVIVSEDGIVITNDHVISGASQIRVTLPGGQDAEAEVVGTDPVTDIAVLRIDANGLPVAPVGTATPAPSDPAPSPYWSADKVTSTTTSSEAFSTTS